MNDNKIYCAFKSSLESFFANDEWKTVYLAFNKIYDLLCFAEKNKSFN